MFQLGKKIQAFADKAPVAVLVRTVLQRDLDPERMDRLFHSAAELQYENKLLFSTVMMVMIDVILKSAKSVNRAFQLHREMVPVTIKALYEKINKLETGVSRELVADGFRNLSPVVDKLQGKIAPILPGFRTLILDGNHFAATQRRLKGLRTNSAGPLPGLALALYDQEYGMVRDVIPCEDGHAQERSLLGPILEQIRSKDCLVADRNFCVIAFMAEIAARGGFFVIRHHGQLKCWKGIKTPELVGVSETGEVYEQRIVITQEKTGTVLKLRRITVKLKQKTRDGDKEIPILTNLKRKDASAIKAYNAVSLVRAALRSELGEAAVEELSWYHLCDETATVWAGMEIAVEPKDWSRLIDGLSDASYAKLLRELVGRMNLVKYKRMRRGPKPKRPQKRSSEGGNHVSTAKILGERNAKKRKILKH